MLKLYKGVNLLPKNGCSYSLICAARNYVFLLIQSHGQYLVMIIFNIQLKNAYTYYLYHLITIITQTGHAQVIQRSKSTPQKICSSLICAAQNYVFLLIQSHEQ